MKPILLVLLLALFPLPVRVPFAVTVIDAQTKRPVPLIRLETVNNIVDYTDNAGVIAFDEPELMNQPVWFGVSGHGYRLPPDGFGYRGVRLTPNYGGHATVAVQRINIAERIQRLTGNGRYEHSARVGMPSPDSDAQGNVPVLGCDTVDTALFQGKLFWLWGDTNRASYPLGNFHTTFATTSLPNTTECKPDGTIHYNYFKSSDGFVKGIAPLGKTGPTWLGALVTLKDSHAVEHLCATYSNIEKEMHVSERGLCEFDTASGIFKKVHIFPKAATLFPDGHAFRDGKWLYFGQATPTLRIPDRYESWNDPGAYEAVQSDIAFTDSETGKPVKAHNGSVAWNPYRKRWISIFTEAGGTSYLGEIRYAEAPTPQGPWRKCIKILTHDQYTFYNPMQHPYFASDGGRLIWFEGTYTVTFSGNTNPTPRYEYNQILYRLNLTDTRLKSAQN